MREQEFKARDKKVQKMSRDGLTEKNLTQGTEQRISGRLADVSFGDTEAEDMEAGRHAGSRTKGNNYGKIKKGRAGKPAENAACQDDRLHLFFRESEILSGKDTEAEGQKTGEKLAIKKQTAEEPAGKLKYQKKYENTGYREEKADRKAGKADRKRTGKKNISDYRDKAVRPGRVRRRLQFETDGIPERGETVLMRRAGRGAMLSAGAEALFSGSREFYEEGQDGTVLEPVQTAGSATRRLYDYRKRRVRGKSYRELRRVESRLFKGEENISRKKASAKDGGLQKKSLSKWFQRQKIKRKYAEAARETAKGAQYTAEVLNSAGQAVRSVLQKAAGRKAVFGIAAAGVLFISLTGTLFSSCSAMLTGIQSAVLSTCYVADDAEINRSELRYTELETDLQADIDNTETDYPDYDEYRYNIVEIGHNPYELMGYLSAAYGDFTYAGVAPELQRLFNSQYQLIREDITEIRTYTDEEGEEHEYEWHVLKTTLSVRPLSEIIAGNLAAGEQTERYGVYMQTLGNRQCYGSPFDFDWIAYVSSPYGYRVHPISGVKDLHNGIDIAVAAGTPVKAVQDGRVVSAGNAGGYGLCIVIEGKNGYRSRYAHCASLSVSAGQEVARGNVIATVGSTGDSTGPHLHLEVTHYGEYLNPYYYVAGGGNGYSADGNAAAGPEFSENPGEAMETESFAAMLEEAEKYLGYPYVWGGSSPSTSFDCSGFVSWVINHSGVGNVGRQTAQGLYHLCEPVRKSDLEPGDLIFFTGTYSTANPVTHVGIYIGGGRMIHCGDPISYANINGSYWNKKFYCGGRLP